MSPDGKTGNGVDVYAQLNEKIDNLLGSNDTIVEHTRVLPDVAQEIRALRTDLVATQKDLVATLANRVPEGSIPLPTHKELLDKQSSGYEALMKTQAEREREFNRTLLRLVIGIFAITMSVMGLKNPLEKLIAGGDKPVVSSP